MNSPRRSRARVIAATKGALRGAAAKPATVRGAHKRQQELKARLKRARTPIAGPKGRLPNPFMMVNDDSNRVCYHCVNTIKRGSLMVVSHKIPYHRNCFKQAEKQAEKELRGKNPGFFGAEAVAGARRVTKIHPVVDRETGERGEIVGTAPGYVKVKWHGRAKSTLIKRSEIRRANPVNSLTQLQEQAVDKLLRVRQPGRRSSGAMFRRSRHAIRVWYGNQALKFGYTAKQIALQWQDVLDMADLERRANPGIMEIAGGLQALDYLSGKLQKKQRRNPNSLDFQRIKRFNFTYAIPGGAWLEDVDGNRDWVSFSVIQKRLGEAWLKRQLKKQGEFTGNWIAVTDNRKANPTVREMSQRFQGKANGSVKEYFASDHAPRLDFSRAGKLVFLKLENSGKQLRIPGAVVTIDPKTEKLWIAGNRAPLFNRKAAHKGELLDFGPLSDICYLTAKAHIGNGKTFEYVHPFGEEGGTLPHLCVDYEGMPVLRGGSYRIKAAGIVD